MSAFGKLFQNADLLDHGGATVPAASLDGTDVVGLYFSAHWCPPCKLFTPQLAATYEKVRKAGKKFEVVFLSGDKDQGSFNEYFGSMPWKALPHANRAVEKALSKHFKVSGIPTLVLLNGKGEVITNDGRAAVSSDPEGEKFPWIPPTVAEALGDKFLKGDEVLSSKDLEGKTVALYFSAHWCPPCKMFTTQLAAVYNKLQAAGKPFEIIFVSSDKDQASFDEYRGSMPWAALPFANRDGKNALSARFNVKGIPSLVVLDGIATANVINGAARAAVTSDPEGAAFPWHPKALNDLSDAGAELNEEVCLIGLLAGLPEAKAKATTAALQAVADAEYAAARAEGSAHASVRFFHDSSDGGLVGKLRQLTKAAGPVLLLLDIPDDGGFYLKKLAGDEEADVAAFLRDYRGGKLDRQQLS